ncbi:MAG TPA: dephospho-CoA kinase [Sedimentisphaerales bacterium]|nr:dephospho-CoA kinase [Sedimentisphaerales bacterium]
MGITGKKPVIGILGGICSGKSTVAAEFAKLGCKVIDADKIAHELLDEPPIKEKIVGLFGLAVLDSAGKIDREKLASVVFTDADKLSSINGIIHPIVLQRAEELIKKYNSQNQVRAIILDMPLLVEVGWDKRCDKLIFVDCEKKLRLNRAKKLGFDKNQIKIRENFQISLDNKANLADNADNTVENNSDFSALARQVTDIFSYIMYNG